MAGDALSDLLEPLVSLRTPCLEDLSTEEVLAKLKEVHVAIRKDKRTDTVVGSLDVKSLYPSLDQDGSAELVAKFVKETLTEIAGVDWRQTQVYIASSMDPHVLRREGVLHLVLRRLKTMGKRP